MLTCSRLVLLLCVYTFDVTFPLTSFLLDVLQECRNQNQKLTEFLSAPENVKQLLDYVTREPAGAIDDRQRFKFPNVASEILTTDTQGIMQVRCFCFCVF